MQGQKLSKRKLDIDISAFAKIGVLPEALDNFVALLGWSHSQPKDFMTLQQLVQNVVSLLFSVYCPLMLLAVLYQIYKRRRKSAI